MIKQIVYEQFLVFINDMVNQVIKFLYVKNVNFNLMIRYCCRKIKDFYIIYRIVYNYFVELDLGGKKIFNIKLQW